MAGLLALKKTSRVLVFGCLSQNKRTKDMAMFRAWLVVLLIAMSVYTAVTVQQYGWNLFDPFFSEMLIFSWFGQFNLDFMFMLSLSALWVSWRHRFSPMGLALGLVAFLGGILFLTVYLLIQSRDQASLETLLLKRVGP